MKVLDLGSADFPYMLNADDMAWVYGLSSLEHLDLGQVDLFHAKDVYMVLYMIPSLTFLSLNEYDLSNANLGLHLNSSKMLPKIEYLDLSINSFDGQLPCFFQNMTSLTFFDLSDYDLNLTWSSTNLLNMIPSLLELHLSFCALHDTLFSPTYFNSSAPSNIQYLDLSFNQIEGRFPYNILSMSSKRVLDLSFNEIKGTFPFELLNMTSLRVLDLSHNHLNSSIFLLPNLLRLDVSANNFEHIKLVGIWRQYNRKELSTYEEMIVPSTNMSEWTQYALEMLDLGGNKLDGPIPESLGRLTSLRVLQLGSNSLTGSVPKALTRIRSLEVLDLSSNALTGPMLLTFLGKLTELYLSENQFSGSIPESLGRLKGLTVLCLESNQLTCSIPASIGKLASLQTLLVSSNMLNGTIPVSLGQLSKLVYLDVSNIFLRGVVLEAHFANLSMLKYLDTMSNRKLSFNISNEWIPPFQLRILYLGSCMIGDGFPQWLQTQRMLEELVLSNTSLSGLLPTWLRKMPIVSYFDLSHNKLSGPLIHLPFKNQIKRFPEYMYLRDNLFNRSFPRSLCKKTYLLFLDVSKNRLSGNIPDCLENLQHMLVLILGSNRMSRVLSNSLGNMSSFENSFNGDVPKDMGDLKLGTLDLGNNEFSGNIPSWIGKHSSHLRVLRLRGNNFTGRIPQSLCNCSYLQILDIAHNNLTGSIPRCFGNSTG